MQIFIEAIKAKEKLCPMTFNIRADDASDHTYQCTGSRCMAWRWVRTNVNNPDSQGDLIESTDTHGFCGLAGTPTAKWW